jgi:hypothetical protein
MWLLLKSRAKSQMKNAYQIPGFSGFRPETGARAEGEDAFLGDLSILCYSCTIRFT